MSDFVSVPQDIHAGEATNLPAKDRSYYACFFQNDTPIAGGEFNHVQQIIRDTISKLAVSISQPGFSFKSRWAAGANMMTVGRTFALVDDMVLEVASTDPSRLINIQLGSPPTQGLRYDFVWLEVWQAGVGPVGATGADVDVFTYGGVDNATLPNDIKQPSPLDEETTRRVQARFRVRVSQNVNFTANLRGFLDPSVHPQGGAEGPLSQYSFRDSGIDREEYEDLWIAGQGSDSDATNLDTTDGYVYALPMFKVLRRPGVIQIPDIDITDLRHATNSDLLGVFDLGDDCSLIVKASPIRFFSCDGSQEMARVNPTTVDPNATPLYGALIASQLQSTVAPGSPPLVVNSNTQVANLNGTYLQGRQPGTGPNAVAILDAGANLTIDGVSMGVADASSPGNDRARFLNVNGDLWLTRNASWDGTVFKQMDSSSSSVATALAADGTFSTYYAHAGAGPGTVTSFGWVQAMSVSEAQGIVTLNEGLVLPGTLPGSSTLPAHGGIQFATATRPRLFSAANAIYLTVNAHTTNGTTFTQIDNQQSSFALSMGGDVGDSLNLKHCAAGGTFVSILRVTGDGALDIRRGTLAPMPSAVQDGLLVLDDRSSAAIGSGAVLKYSKNGVFRPVWASADNPPAIPDPFDDEFDSETQSNVSVPPNGWRAANPRAGQTYASTSASTLALWPGAVDTANVVPGLFSGGGNYHSAAQMHGIERDIPSVEIGVPGRLLAKSSLRLDAYLDQSASATSAGNSVITEGGIYVKRGANIITLSLYRKYEPGLKAPMLYVSCDKWNGYGQWVGSFATYNSTSGHVLTTSDRLGLPWNGGQTVIFEAGMTASDVSSPDGGQWMRFRVAEIADGAETTGFLVAYVPMNTFLGGYPDTFGLFNSGQGVAAAGVFSSGQVVDYVRRMTDNAYIIGGAGSGSGSGDSVADAPVSVTASTVNNVQQVNVSWVPPTNNGGLPVTGYKVYRQVNQTGAYTLVSGPSLVSGTLFNDAGVSYGTTYIYKVTAINGEGEGPLSLPSNPAMPIGLPGAPSQPTLNLISVGNASVLKQIGVSWNAPTVTNGSAVLGYKLYRRLSGSGQNFTSINYIDGDPLDVFIFGTTFTDHFSLAGGSIYDYAVSAANAVGEGPMGPLNTIALPNPIAAPSAPLNLIATGGNSQIQLSWTPPSTDGGSPLTSYKIYRAVGELTPSNTAYTTLSPSTLSFIDSAVTNGTVYHYYVSATNIVWEGPRSAEAKAIPVPPPVNVTVPGQPFLSVQPGHELNYLVWTAPLSNGNATITGYRLYRNGGQLLAQGGGSMLAYMDTGLTDGTQYCYYVVASNAGGQPTNSVGTTGDSPASNVACGTPTNVPNAPAPPSVTAGDAQNVVVWAAPSSNGGLAVGAYTLYRGGVPVITLDSSVTTFTDTGRQNGTTYYYQVSASNGNGEGPKSASTPGTPVARIVTPGPVTNLNNTWADFNSPSPIIVGVSAGNGDGNAYNHVTWSPVDGAVGYTIYCHAEQGNENNPLSPSQFDVTQTDIYFRVAYANDGVSAQTGWVGVAAKGLDGSHGPISYAQSHG